ncbi:MAG: radical SAM protein [Nitrospirota bacterium]
MKIFKFRDILPQLHNIVLKRRLKFYFELIPYEVKSLSYKRIRNLFLTGLNQFILPSRPLGYPVIAQVEPVNFCNLSCPLCLTTSQTFSRPRSILPFESFKKVIDDAGDYMLLVVLWIWGEPFLNPDVFKMIQYAKAKDIVLHSSTNGNVRFDEDKAERLVDSGLDTLVFAVDGVSQETYGKYRRGGNLELVLSNIKTIVRVKKKKNARTPRLIMRFVVMQHNEEEIPSVKKLAKDLEVDFLALKTVDMPHERGDNLDGRYAPGNKKFQRYEYEAGTYKRKRKPFTCMRPWKRLTLDALGEIIPCEYEYKDLFSFGNLNTGKSSMAIWKSDKATMFRKRFNRGNNDFYLCKDCTYKNSVADDCVVDRIDISQSN